MTAYNTTTSSLDSLLPSIVAEALFVASERSIMRGLVKNYTLPPQSGKTVKVPVYGLQTAAALTEGTDLESANIVPTSATLTVGEVGLMTAVTDLARMTSATDVVADVGRLFGEAIARKIDTDLTALFSSFSTNTVGNASTTISASSIFQAVAKLRQSGVPSQDIFAVLSPAVAYDLKANLTNTFANPNAGIVQNEAMSMGFIGMLAGVPIYETANLANNGTAGDYVGGVFHRDALGLAILEDITVETQRDASLRATEIVATAKYAKGVVYEAYGVAVTADSTIL